MAFNMFQHVSILNQGLMTWTIWGGTPYDFPNSYSSYGLLEIVDVQWTDAGGSLE